MKYIVIMNVSRKVFNTVTFYRNEFKKLIGVNIEFDWEWLKKSGVVLMMKRLKKYLKIYLKEICIVL